MVDINHDMVLVYTDALGNRHLDVDVGLVRHNPSDVVLCEAVALGDGLDGRSHVEYGVLIDSPTLLIDKVFAGVHTLVTWHLGGTASSHVKILVALAIYAIIAVDESHLLCRCLHHNAGSTIAEDGTGVAVLVVGHRTHVVAATDDDAFVPTGTDIAGTRLHRIKETSTSSLHVEAESAGQTAIANDKRCGGREMVVGRRSSTDNKLHRVGVSPSLAKQLSNGSRHQIGGAATLFGFEDVARLDTNPLHYPFVAGIYNPRHFLVVEDIVGHISAHAGYDGIYHLSFLFDCYLAAIVTASRAYRVIDVELATVGTYCQCGSYCLVVSSSFESPSLGLSSFRMCHCYLLFNDLLFTINYFF